jgi:hypothetical protein
LAHYYGVRAVTVFCRGVRFWERVYRNALSMALHLPIAADIASMSANLLFGEAPDFQVPDAHGDKPDASAQQCEARLAELVDKADVIAKLLEAAETCSGMGGVFLKVDYDKSLCDHPLLTVVQVDAALPTFKWGMLDSVIFWREIERSQTGDKVVRHLEYHDRQMVQHAVYVGNDTLLGRRVDLGEYGDTAGLADVVATDDLDVVYIPNTLPNRRFRGIPLGRADTADAIQLMEALDEAYTSLMRDVRLGASRIIVPEDYLDVQRVGGSTQTSFDMEREIFCPLSIEGVDGDVNKPTFIQPAIRYVEHLAIILELMTRVVSLAGFATQSFGLGQDASRTEAASALRVKERRSLSTKAKKERYWGPAVEYILGRMLVIDAREFGSGISPFPVSCAFGESFAPDRLELAQVVELLNRGVAISTQEKVEMLHPEWGEAQKEEEVARIDGVVQQAVQQEKDKAVVQMQNMDGTGSVPIEAMPAVDNSTVSPVAGGTL